MVTRDIAIRSLSWTRLALAATLCCAVLSVSPAGATLSSCFFNKSEATVTYQIVTPTKVTVFVAEGGELKWKDTVSKQVTDCGNGTVNNTDLISTIDYNDSNDSELTLDLSRRFGPGLTPEKVGISEIEFAIDGGLAENALRILGRNNRDRIAIGEEGVNLNKDGDDDIETFEDYSDFEIIGNGGNDLLSAAGGAGTGGPFQLPVTIYGLAGDDALLGSANDDTLLGSGGRDSMVGGAGGDIIFGNAGGDDLRGGSGGDELDGLAGNDKLRGNGGPDDLDGGGGSDDCEGGPGADTVIGCNP